MNAALIIGLEECIRQAGKLSELLEQDAPALSKSVSGDIFDAYQRHMKEECELAEQLKRELMRCR